MSLTTGLLSCQAKSSGGETINLGRVSNQFLVGLQVDRNLLILDILLPASSTLFLIWVLSCYSF